MKYIQLKDIQKTFLNVNNVDMIPERCRFAPGGRDGQALVNLSVSGVVVQFVFSNPELAYASHNDLIKAVDPFGEAE